MKVFRKSLVVLSGLLLSMNIYAQVIADGSYYIISEHSGDCVELNAIDENIKAIQSTCKDTESQKFTLTHSTDDKYTISSLAIGQPTQSNGTYIYNSATVDDFKIELINGFYKIKSIILH